VAQHPAVATPLAVLLTIATLAAAANVSADISGELTPSDAALIGISVAALTAMPIAGALRWLLLLPRAARHQITFAAAFSALLVTRFIGLFTSAVLADMAGRFAAFASHDRGRGAIATSLVADRGLDFLFAICLIPASILTFAGAGSGWVAVAVAAAAAVPAVFFGFARGVLRTDRFGVRPWALTVLRNGLLALSCYSVAVVLSVPLSFSELWAITALSQLTIVVAFTPGAWGVLEAGWVGMLAALDISTDDALEFALSVRVVQVLTFAGGAAVAVGVGALRARRIRQAPAPTTAQSG
jgi:hypothetical protein